MEEETTVATTSVTTSTSMSTTTSVKNAAPVRVKFPEVVFLYLPEAEKGPNGDLIELYGWAVPCAGVLSMTILSMTILTVTILTILTPLTPLTLLTPLTILDR